MEAEQLAEAIRFIREGKKEYSSEYRKGKKQNDFIEDLGSVARAAGLTSMFAGSAGFAAKNPLSRKLVGAGVATHILGLAADRFSKGRQSRNLGKYINENRINADKKWLATDQSGLKGKELQRAEKMSRYKTNDNFLNILNND